MATLSINIPNAQLAVVADAFAKTFAMPNNGDGSAPTQAQKVEFARQKVIEYITQTVRNQKVQEIHAALPQIPDKPVDLT